MGLARLRSLVVLPIRISHIMFVTYLNAKGMIRWRELLHVLFLRTELGQSGVSGLASDPGVMRNGEIWANGRTSMATLGASPLQW